MDKDKSLIDPPTSDANYNERNDYYEESKKILEDTQDYTELLEEINHGN